MLGRLRDPVLAGGPGQQSGQVEVGVDRDAGAQPGREVGLG